MSETPPPPPPSSPPPATPDAPPPPPPGEPTETTSDDRTMAMLAHLLGIFTWFLGPLLIWLLKKDQSSFIDDQGKEALNFQITIGLFYIGVAILSCVTLGLGGLLAPVVWIVAIVFAILGTVAANRGERYRYPLAIRLIK